MNADLNAGIRGGTPGGLPGAGKSNGSGWNRSMKPGGTRAITTEKDNGSAAGMKNSESRMDIGKNGGCGSGTDPVPTGNRLL